MESNQKTKTKYNSPIPILIQFRDFIFGTQTPDRYTQTSVYVNLFIWFLLFIWSLISYFVITFQEVILEQKGIPVESIIISRGKELGFDPVGFTDHLLTFHFLSIICWISVFIGIVLMWRKNINFIYFFFGGTIVYLTLSLFYMSFSYYREDVTLFDKIVFTGMNVNSLIYYFLLKKEISGGNLSFFGEGDE